MKFTHVILIGVVLLGCSCGNNFLDVKPDKKINIPSEIRDFEALLNNTDIHNLTLPTIGEISSDDYYLSFDQWSSILYPIESNGHIWANDLFGNVEPLTGFGWLPPYRQVLYANMALEGLDNISIGARDEKWSDLKGRALFYRAWAYFHLSQLFSYPAIDLYLDHELGLPIRLSSDINLVVDRSTVRATWDQIHEDLVESLDLLPVHTAIPTIPSKVAGHGLLAKFFLQQNKFDEALVHADLCLQYSSKLIDYNTIDTSAPFPFARFNEEVLFHAVIGGSSLFQPSRFFVDSLLYDSYDEHDIRKQAFFYSDDKGVHYKGSYNSSAAFFGGIAVDEILLIRAECQARKGVLDVAISDLNYLLNHRYKSGKWASITASTQEELINMILAERRKELIFRGIRWHDLRRYNFSELNDYSFTLTRNLGGEMFSLPPGDVRYIISIPNEVIAISKISQNPR